MLKLTQERMTATCDFLKITHPTLDCELTYAIVERFADGLYQLRFLPSWFGVVPEHLLSTDIPEVQQVILEMESMSKKVTEIDPLLKSAESITLHGDAEVAIRLAEQAMRKALERQAELIAKFKEGLADLPTVEFTYDNSAFCADSIAVKVKVTGAMESYHINTTLTADEVAKVVYYNRDCKGLNELMVMVPTAKDEALDVPRWPYGINWYASKDEATATNPYATARYACNDSDFFTISEAVKVAV